MPGATTEEDDRQNRQAVMFDTRGGEACLALRRHLRLAWFRTHCLAVPLSASEAGAANCARALDEVDAE